MVRVQYIGVHAASVRYSGQKVRQARGVLVSSVPIDKVAEELPGKGEGIVLPGPPGEDGGEDEGEGHVERQQDQDYPAHRRQAYRARVKDTGYRG